MSSPSKAHASADERLSPQTSPMQEHTRAPPAKATSGEWNPAAKSAAWNPAAKSGKSSASAPETMTPPTPPPPPPVVPRPPPAPILSQTDQDAVKEPAVDEATAMSVTSSKRGPPRPPVAANGSEWEATSVGATSWPHVNVLTPPPPPSRGNS